MRRHPATGDTERAISSERTLELDPRCPLHRISQSARPQSCRSSLAAGWFTRRLFRIASLNGTTAVYLARVTSSLALSAVKSQYHEMVKFGQVNGFGEKGERTVGESLFLRLREQTS